MSLVSYGLSLGGPGGGTTREVVRNVEIELTTPEYTVLLADNTHSVTLTPRAYDVTLTPELSAYIIENEVTLANARQFTVTLNSRRYT